ncbi:type I restriction enzyme HsdR N-terminal domain-containing protein [Flavobacterium sp. CS20]|jgi:hypothetical protein|uniref:type I restriction enzyme HsdR N-terminal domain-containing protein n=1 Tax=Flavobacterium sp. CS20 TaxID=2775246 RepID=UPI001B3A4349|nr:type I restriction enzyme HsdR N-terminal domain-containing protein [Flavobacterium sp. CS20]QTY28178.1 type I restriction enzyme HsdR N-terminal domain-containing protein [Flavobacterium sp. CS20]
MQNLNFPKYDFRFQKYNDKIRIFSVLRKKFIVLTPEEWVRQHCVNFLIEEKGCSTALMNEEKKVVINNMSKRYDIVVFEPNGKIQLVVECKSPEVEINQETFDQIARYNLSLNAQYLMLTNGLNHYFCQLDYKNESYIFLQELPKFD